MKKFALGLLVASWWVMPDPQLPVQDENVLNFIRAVLGLAEAADLEAVAA